MIVNLHSLTTLQAEWQGVVRMRERMRHIAFSTFAFDPLTSPAFGNILYNLPLVLAFNVLKQVLLQVREDGKFTSSGHQLGDLVDSAKTSLPWIDWQCLRKGVERQSEATHAGRLFGDIQCLQDISDIEAQLLAWGVITTCEPSRVQ